MWYYGGGGVYWLYWSHPPGGRSALCSFTLAVFVCRSLVSGCERSWRSWTGSLANTHAPPPCRKSPPECRNSCWRRKMQPLFSDTCRTMNRTQRRVRVCSVRFVLCELAFLRNTSARFPCDGLRSDSCVRDVRPRRSTLRLCLCGGEGNAACCDCSVRRGSSSL